MFQKFVAKLNGSPQTLLLPDEEMEIYPGMRWGNYAALFTPAYWKTMCWLADENNNYQSHRLGETLAEEIAACLLGGYGIPAEVGLGAFHRIKQCGLLSETPSAKEIFEVLSQPLSFRNKPIRYRFAKQKSKYLSSALLALAHSDPPLDDDLKLRAWLLELDGIGFKTASWITRNWLHSNSVAIIDIHIQRAGLLMSLYHPKMSPAKDYIKMEAAFLDFADKIGVRASQLDALIWREMKCAGNLPLKLIRQKGSCNS